MANSFDVKGFSMQFRGNKARAEWGVVVKATPVLPKEDVDHFNQSETEIDLSGCNCTFTGAVKWLTSVRQIGKIAECFVDWA